MEQGRRRSELDECSRNAWQRRLVVNPKALAHVDAGGARARQAPPEAELERAPASPLRQATTLRGGVNATSSVGKTELPACVAAPQEAQSTQCPRSWSGPRCGAPPSLLQSSAGTKTEIAAEAPNVALDAFGEGAKARVFRTRAQTIAARATARASLPICPATLTIVPSRAVWTCTRRTTHMKRHMEKRSRLVSEFSERGCELARAILRWFDIIPISDRRSRKKHFTSCIFATVSDLTPLPP